IIISPRAIDGAARGPDRGATIGFRLPAAEYFAADQPDLVGADAGDSPVAGGAQARRRLIPPVVAAFEITIEGRRDPITAAQRCVVRRAVRRRRNGSCRLVVSDVADRAREDGKRLREV